MAKKKPVAVKKKKKSMQDLLMEIHDPQAKKCAEADQLINAKRELDRILGLVSTDGKRSLSPFALEPFGGSNLVCTAIQEKLKNGKPTGEHCITVFVRHKLPEDTDELLVAKIPDSVMGIPTDVVEFGKADYHTGDTGGKVFGADGWQGSFGAVVKLQPKGDIGYILSNQHVLNHSGDAANQNTPVFGPGGFGSADLIGKLTTWTSLNDSHVDGALAVTKSVSITTNYQGAFQLNPAPLTDAEIQSRLDATGGNGFLVKKFGPITSQTFGVCTPEPTVLVNGTPRVFQDQLKVLSTSSGSPFSHEGDSGSLVVTHPDNRPVGLLWGGAGSFSFANRIQNVISMFQISAFVSAANQIQP